MRNSIIADPAEIFKYILKDDGIFPNSDLFLLIYKSAFKLTEKDSAASIDQTFKTNGWSNSWRSGIFNYAHYHSNTHEVLGIYSGTATVRFGGANGIKAILTSGDVVIIPAGVAHQCISADNDFQCVGAYPDGRDYDIKKGEFAERPQADENIQQVPLPDKDPVYGDGPLQLNWEMQ